MALKREDVIRVTKELVAEYGEDYVYNSDGTVCAYGPTDRADGCIVGLIAKRLDPEMYNHLVAYEESALPYSAQPWGVINDEDPQGIIQAEDQDLKLLYAMQDAQSKQDVGYTWGDAVKPILELED